MRSAVPGASVVRGASRASDSVGLGWLLPAVRLGGNSASQVFAIHICSHRWEAQVRRILYAQSSNHLTVNSVLIVP